MNRGSLLRGSGEQVFSSAQVDCIEAEGEELCGLVRVGITESNMDDMVYNLGISWKALLVYLVNFAVLLFLLKKFAWKPIVEMLDERSERIREGLEKADLAEKRAGQIDQDAQKALGEARKEGQALIAQAAEVGNRLREEAKQQAKEDGEALIIRARAEIQMERDQAIDQLRKDFVETAISAARKVLDESLDEKRHRKVIEQVLKESASLKKN